MSPYFNFQLNSMMSISKTSCYLIENEISIKYSKNKVYHSKNSIFWVAESESSTDFFIYIDVVETSLWFKRF